ncbi:MAG TPA: DUF4105 domain-containing protein [Dokdonella sp.]|uniref:Lnb N-terminal periplasmic domain-containing protein n=1 Tax=Dokdonella sp. TaxID=2291710 RepID=UPI0025C48495|nr:DUF4105 domain-containing protein [Dokdonella sp.]MBX3692075.1 DUF4105 domain-containing protein [Dokdonella sp.]MCW5566965.1 DUF4105 domain-containing protein [Dokdonella sp.]HNR91912.1 DUF4105 domain-containing protein [Dokdonella sp.]
MRLLFGVWLLLACGAAPAQEAATRGLEISLLTIGPGEVYWERFGHNALVVRDRSSGLATSYNYGTFDFEEDDFLVNFARGRMTYQAFAMDADDDIDWYSAQGRSVVEQRLRLNDTQALNLARFLQWNAEPENARYRYEYFTSNCSTRVRDALDAALGGALKAQLTAPSRGYTYRMLTDALMSPQPWLMAVLDAGLGPYADQRLSFWEDSFVPMQLMGHLREVNVPGPDGTSVPLVAAERVISFGRLPAPPALPPDLRWPFFIAGLALAAWLLALASHRRSVVARHAFAVTASAIALVCAVAGIILMLLWLGTEHRPAWANENLLVLNPLCLLLLPAWWRARHDAWDCLKPVRVIAVLIAVLAGLALFVKILPWFPQANLPWILLLLPVHAALAWIVVHNARGRAHRT